MVVVFRNPGYIAMKYLGSERTATVIVRPHSSEVNAPLRKHESIRKAYLREPGLSVEYPVYLSLEIDADAVKTKETIQQAIRYRDIYGFRQTRVDIGELLLKRELLHLWLVRI